MNKVLFIITFLIGNGLYTLNTNLTTVVSQTNSTETTISDTGGGNSGGNDHDPDPEPED
ncbi:hypothetical protein KUL118_20320 [Tenacibaculum sp. KUL118]|uniref:Uncharacterized protein n=1 Tax=Tenacibaculum sp. Pbs-1 TaxID=3238748 RepID=A0AB33L045_9FLAO|nr:hypothetical protein [Tenacibaculum sp. XPcli2-G]MCO7185431.1 hypothetical protein [Tenacibaculum sp. XPcli2-G]BFF37899.1 hypothetical protein BACT7_27610 [Tenacibaculum mesophilum]GFD79170.1 hypothetical protein KUL118_20320 [Tenacibaculum sp. KUL118]